MTLDRTLFSYLACEDPSMDPEHPSGRCANTAFRWCTNFDQLLCHAHARRHYCKPEAHEPVYEASPERRERAVVHLPMLSEG